MPLPLMERIANHEPTKPANMGEICSQAPLKASIRPRGGGGLKVFTSMDMLRWVGRASNTLRDGELAK